KGSINPSQATDSHSVYWMYANGSRLLFSFVYRDTPIPNCFKFEAHCTILACCDLPIKATPTEPSKIKPNMTASSSIRLKAAIDPCSFINDFKVTVLRNVLKELIDKV
ncbi:MAG: hypothetical protein ACREGC_01375, partial [Minisyncoccia bacterium]